MSDIPVGLLLLIISHFVVGLVTWAITYSYLNYARKYKCQHNYTKFCGRYTNKSHKVAHICTKCGDIKKVKL